MRAVHIVKPSRGKKRYQVRFENWDGKTVKVSGDESKGATQRLATRLAMLVEARANGDPPPSELKSWIGALNPKRAKRLIELGLLDRRRVLASREIGKHLDDYEKQVGERRGNTAAHARKMAGAVRRVVEGLKIKSYLELNEHDVLVWLGEQKGRGGETFSATNRRYYLVALGDFCAWMLRDKRAVENPFASTPKPRPTPGWDRRPFTVAEMQKLLGFLATHGRYEDQGNRALWHGRDRMLLYWTAVKTGYRRGELAKLRKYNLRLDGADSGGVAFIDLGGKDTKNRSAAAVPIPPDLAAELRVYAGELEEDEPLFWLPAGDGVVGMLHRDMQAAGLGRLLGLEGQVVDFHTLRATAIVWWLTVDRLDQLEVQRLARFKTLAMVQKYARGFKLESYGWLNAGPSMLGGGEKEGSGGAQIGARNREVG